MMTMTRAINVEFEGGEGRGGATRRKGGERERQGSERERWGEVGARIRLKTCIERIASHLL